MRVTLESTNPSTRVRADPAGKRCLLAVWVLASLIAVVGFGISKSYAPHIGTLGEEEFDWAAFTVYASIAAAIVLVGYVARYTLEAIAALSREQRREISGVRNELTNGD